MLSFCSPFDGFDSHSESQLALDCNNMISATLPKKAIKPDQNEAEQSNDEETRKRFAKYGEGCCKCGKPWSEFRDEVAIISHIKAKHTYYCNFEQCSRRFTRFQLLVEHRQITGHYGSRCKNPIFTAGLFPLIPIFLIDFSNKQKKKKKTHNKTYKNQIIDGKRWR
ncbi:hypothetical protein RFI_00983 [Reticulomyxa filosa]|uniref:C2H2-type domain-containing protein n=1 Tax=Reticulomyxa filosa TaxID=46433 RepID=X6PC39_RETFI|nr:hypothetical protein RFI_00983 [Reticulomyxa filosa]|eukprot:ETO36080.1 hypothetical protein RFI_00983 [Reticulomyxa filosa]